MTSLVAERIRAGSQHATPPGFGLADTGEALGEAEVNEFASRLLNSRNHAERDHLLAAILIEGSGGRLSSPLGSALGGMLKSVARRSVAGRASSGEALGLELEGLPDQELELDVARPVCALGSGSSAQRVRGLGAGASSSCCAVGPCHCGRSLCAQSSAEALLLFAAPHRAMGSSGANDNCPRWQLPFHAGGCN